MLARGRRSSSTLPSSHEDRARKAFERLTRGVLPGSHKELQRALKRAARDHDKKIEEVTAAERKAKETEAKGAADADRGGEEAEKVED